MFAKVNKTSNAYLVARQVAVKESTNAAVLSMNRNTSVILSRKIIQNLVCTVGSAVWAILLTGAVQELLR